MKFFIDSGNIDEIREAKEMGVLDGVTTNPSLVAQTGKPFEEVARSICEIVDGPVSLEVVSLEWKEMIAEGKALRKYGNNVVVKIPMTPDGLKAIKALSDEGIPVNTTLIFQPLQALLAAKAGAAYVSPFIGRLDDLGQDGMQLIADVVQIFNAYKFKTEVLVASVRHPVHILQAAKLGAGVVTAPLKVIAQMTKHPLTDIGLKKFLDDWNKVARPAT